jgi:hypothetical protein
VGDEGFGQEAESLIWLVMRVFTDQLFAIEDQVMAAVL